ncbi:MAG: 23S rRNA pseudouridine(1911/1915/1917) synthase RluD [Gammaproteobacteria bacterium]|nr:23S rRNA pseudouridine(1911/1915/1917) synthase RluD [Gammaproteobacteria bacterium]
MSRYLIQQQIFIEQQESSVRLDQCLAKKLPDFSRSKIQSWIKLGYIVLNGVVCVPKQKLYFGDQVDINIPLEKKIEDKAEDIQFEIVYQDDSIFVINKPVGLVVHPAAGHQSGTLLNGLLAIDKNLEQLPRAGIVHRLDKDTSGIMVVARTLKAHFFLVDQLQQRLVKREYRAITQGVLTAGRTVEQPLGRHPKERKKMAVVADGKEAVTHFSVRKRYRDYTDIDVRLETGRTHQIRVHMAFLRYPLLGDQLYGGRLSLPKGITDELSEYLKQFKRQALHAENLSFTHPETLEWVSYHAPMPEDMVNLLSLIEQSDASQA